MIGYLACPYSHPLPAVHELRFQIVSEYAARLMEQGWTVFSPISHSHPIADYLPPELSQSWEFWKVQDLPILEKCDRLFVLRLPGWEMSKGVAAEIAHAEKCGIPIEYLDYASY